MHTLHGLCELEAKEPTTGREIRILPAPGILSGDMIADATQTTVYSYRTLACAYSCLLQGPLAK